MAAETAAGQAAYDSNDNGGALAEFRGPAEAGDAEAQFYLGLIHMRVTG